MKIEQSSPLKVIVWSKQTVMLFTQVNDFLLGHVMAEK